MLLSYCIFLIDSFNLIGTYSSSQFVETRGLKSVLQNIVNSRKLVHYLTFSSALYHLLAEWIYSHLGIQMHKHLLKTKK